MTAKKNFLIDVWNGFSFGFLFQFQAINCCFLFKNVSKLHTKSNVMKRFFFVARLQIALKFTWWIFQIDFPEKKCFRLIWVFWIWICIWLNGEKNYCWWGTFRWEELKEILIMLVVMNSLISFVDSFVIFRVFFKLKHFSKIYER